MPRPVSYGTPGRTKHYVFPRPAYPLVVASLGGAVLAFVLLGVLDVGGRQLDLLRVPLMPGALVARHSFLACEACHVPLKGVSNTRCQRCHDESGPGRRTFLAHVGRHYTRMAPGAAAMMATPVERDCVSCHVEHRGRSAALVERDSSQCVVCHGEARDRPGASGKTPQITSLADHPEFALGKEAASGKTLEQTTRLWFSHKDHVQEIRSVLPAAQQARAGDAELCASCHHIDPTAARATDFDPIAAPRDCFRCHNHEKHLKVKAVPASELVLGIGEDGGMRPLACDAAPKDFRCADGSVEKTAVVHRDPWVMLNIRKLRRELYPEEHAREVARLRERLARLRRRLYLGQRMAGLSDDDLTRRRQSIVENMRDLDARLQAREGRAADPKGGLSRVEEVVAALRASEDAPSADLLQSETAQSTPSAPGLSDTDFQLRRGELLDLLDAIAAAPDASDALKRRADVLRARLYAVQPGEAARVGLQRAREQRGQDLARLDDEISARRRRDLPRAEPDTGLAQVTAALEETRGRLLELTALEAFPPVTDADARTRKETALEALTGREHQTGCAKCHRFDKGTMGEPVLAAEPVLTLSRFTHARHLRATYPDDWTARLTAQPLPVAQGETAAVRSASLPRCAYCHGDMERSTLSTELHVQPIADCRACHAPGLQRQDCQLCHLYHPPQARRP